MMCIVPCVFGTLMILSLDQISHRSHSDDFYNAGWASDAMAHDSSGTPGAVKDPFSCLCGEAVEHSDTNSGLSHSTKKGTNAVVALPWKAQHIHREQPTCTAPSIFDACCGTLMNHSMIVASRTILAPD